MDLLTSLTLLGYCFFIRRFVRWPMESIPFLVVSLVVVLFYFSAYGDFLKITSSGFLLVGAILFLSAPIYLPQNRQELFAKYFTPGLAVYSFYLTLFAVIAHYFVVMIEWDEYARWLPHAKLIYFENHLLSATDTTIDKDYPPGGALFYYLFFKLGGYAEPRMNVAQLFLLLSPLVILFRRFTWEKWRDVFILFSVILLILSFLFVVRLGPVGGIMMDHPTGLFFGGILASYFALQKERGLWFYLLLPCMAFLLFKPMLYAFIAVMGMIVLCDQLFLWKMHQVRFRQVMLFSLIAIGCAVIVISFQHYLHQVNGQINWSFGNLFTSHVTSPLSSAQIHQIVVNYLFSLPKPIIYTLVMLLVCGWLYTKSISSLVKKRLLISNGLILFGFLGYMGLMIFVYLYGMTPNLSLTMNSFWRFMSIYLIGWMLMLFAQAIYLVDGPLLPANLTLTSRRKTQIVQGLMVFIGIYLTTFLLAHHLISEKQKNWIATRMELKKIANLAFLSTPTNAKIGVVWVGEEGLIQSIISYEIMPKRNYVFIPYVVQQPTYFAAEAMKLDYLILGHVNEAFWQTYQGLFVDHHRTPLIKITLCADENFNLLNRKGCTKKEAPAYLYKVTREEGKLRLVNAFDSEG